MAMQVKSSGKWKRKAARLEHDRQIWMEQRYERGLSVKKGHTRESPQISELAKML
jgi:hypothetical protein